MSICFSKYEVRCKNRIDVEMDLIIRNGESKIVSLGTIGVSLKIVKTRFFSRTNEKGF
jgi:hypothetical protein